MLTMPALSVGATAMIFVQKAGPVTAGLTEKYVAKRRLKQTWWPLEIRPSDDHRRRARPGRRTDTGDRRGQEGVVVGEGASTGACQGASTNATVKDMFEAIGERPSWLEVVAVTVHIRNAKIIGNAFWDLHGPRLEESETLVPVAALRRSSRLIGVHHLTKVAWREAGGEGRPPDALVSAFALNLSTFAAQALMIDFDQTPAQIGELTADILKTLLWRAVDAQDAARDATTNGVTGAQ